MLRNWLRKLFFSPQRVGEFEKVSFEQFESAMRGVCYFKPEELESMYKNLKLPERATSGSAGFDFMSPFTVRIEPGASLVIPTGIRVKLEDGWWLSCLPRSGLGFKYGVRLNNTVGVIDGDYYYSDNEGHIFAKITNGDQTLNLKYGDNFMQSIFLPYGITYSDNATGVRNGGFGSTDKSK